MVGAENGCRAVGSIRKKSNLNVIIIEISRLRNSTKVLGINEVAIILKVVFYEQFFSRVSGLYDNYVLVMGVAVMSSCNGVGSYVFT